MPATEQRVSLPPRYRVVRHIANGGMASVWAAEDELLGRLVAVKLLSRAYDSDERARRRFLREARAAARLSDCRHVVTVYDIGEHDDRAFMVMEHFGGGSVADRLRRGRAVPRRLAVRWLREAAIGLDCAHEKDVVHRDVKPANLLLDEQGRLAVGDFGIATVASEASVTQTGQVLGTAAYISPEQARGLPATAASDRYALAVVAFELLTGERPFALEHPAAQARAHVEDDVPAASEVAADISPAVDAVVRAGMAKEPDERPATAEDFVDRLERALRDDAPAVAAAPPTAVTRRFGPPVRPTARETRVARAQTHPPTPPPTSGVVVTRRQPRRWSWIAALAALLLVAGAVAAIALTGGGSGRPGTTTGDGAREASTPAGSAGSGTTSTAKSSSSSSSSASQRSGSTSARSATSENGTRASKAPASTPSTGTQPAAPSGDPKALNNQGFALIQQGNPAAAVPLLQQSVQAFRAQGRTGEIDYAFALFNLATALRATGDPASAIPLLEERLRISGYKRGVVQRELGLARQQAGQAPSGSSATSSRGRGPGHGKGGGGDRSGPGDGGGDGED